MAIPTGSEWTAAPSVGYPDASILCTPGVVSAGIWTWNRYGAALEIWLKPSVPMTATARKARGVASAVISAVWPGAKTVPLGPASKVAGPIHSAHRPGQRARAWKPRSLSLPVALPPTIFSPNLHAFAAPSPPCRLASRAMLPSEARPRCRGAIKCEPTGQHRISSHSFGRLWRGSQGHPAWPEVTPLRTPLVVVGRPC